MAIDEVSKTIGSFETLLKSHGDALIVIQSGIKDIRDYQILQNGKIEKAHGRIDDVEEDMITKTGAMKAIIGGGLFAGAGGSGILAAIKSYLGIV